LDGEQIIINNILSVSYFGEKIGEIMDLLTFIQIRLE